MIQETITSKASPRAVWHLWKQASYWDENRGHFQEGQSGIAKSPKGKKASFKILAIQEGSSFTLEWRAPCLKIAVTHRVELQGAGSKIIYDFHLKGLVAWPLEFLLKKRIRAHLKRALSEFVEILEK